MDVEEKRKTHIATDYFARIYPKKETITVEPMENHINCKTIGTILGYRDVVNMDTLVRTTPMCNKLGRLSQGWKTTQELTQYSSFFTKKIKG